MRAFMTAVAGVAVLLASAGVANGQVQSVTAPYVAATRECKPDGTWSVAAKAGTEYRMRTRIGTMVNNMFVPGQNNSPVHTIGLTVPVGAPPWNWADSTAFTFTIAPNGIYVEAQLQSSPVGANTWTDVGAAKTALIQ